VSRLKSIPEKFPDTEIVVIEASGMANPSTFKTMLIESRLNEIYQTDKVIAIVDPVTLPVLYKTLPNIKTQIAMANQIILNKIDTIEESQIDLSEKIIRELNPFAPITKTYFCKIDYNPISTIKIENNTDTHLDNPSHFSRYSYRKNQPIKLENLKNLILKYEKDIYRIKGFISIDNDELKFVDYDGNQLTIEPTSSKKIKSLEFIFNSNITDKIKNDINKLNLI
jgi:G3E family GTPase